MSNTEQTEVAIKLSPTYWKLAPKAKVYIDDKLVFDNEVKENTDVKWLELIEDGEHTLIIELYGKDKYQTILENGLIVKDQLLNIDSISFDEIEIGILKHKLSNYYPNPTNENPNPQPLNNCINLGFNGQWKLKFTTPIYIWLLENM